MVFICCVFNGDHYQYQDNDDAQQKEEDKDLSGFLGFGQPGPRLQQHHPHPRQAARQSSVHHLTIKIMMMMMMM